MTFIYRDLFNFPCFIIFNLCISFKVIDHLLQFFGIFLKSLCICINLLSILFNLSSRRFCRFFFFLFLFFLFLTHKFFILSTVMLICNYICPVWHSLLEFLFRHLAANTKNFTYSILRVF